LCARERRCSPAFNLRSAGRPGMLRVFFTIP
jgi:hypothetical protein